MTFKAYVNKQKDLSNEEKDLILDIYRDWQTSDTGSDEDYEV